LAHLISRFSSEIQSSLSELWSHDRLKSTLSLSAEAAETTQAETLSPQPSTISGTSATVTFAPRSSGNGAIAIVSSDTLMEPEFGLRRNIATIAGERGHRRGGSFA
jgi:hypothetical protein